MDTILMYICNNKQMIRILSAVGMLHYNILKKDKEYYIYKELNILGNPIDAWVVSIFSEEDKEMAISKYNILCNGNR